jgi:hypothetical protein
VKVDKSKSIYQESPLARTEFDRRELKRLRFLLRRLQFLEAKDADNTARAVSTGGSEVFVEWEIEALEFVLDELEFLSPRENQEEGSE